MWQSNNSIQLLTNSLWQYPGSLVFFKAWGNGELYVYKKSMSLVP